MALYIKNPRFSTVISLDSNGLVASQWIDSDKRGLSQMWTPLQVGTTSDVQYQSAQDKSLFLAVDPRDSQLIASASPSVWRIEYGPQGTNRMAVFRICHVGGHGKKYLTGSDNGTPISLQPNSAANGGVNDQVWAYEGMRNAAKV